MAPVTKEIWIQFCTSCGGTVSDNLCMSDCVYDDAVRPEGTVRLAVYTLKETKDIAPL